MSSNTSEENFEWVETPPAPSPTNPTFDCGVKTTSVSHWLNFELLVRLGSGESAR